MKSLTIFIQPHCPHCVRALAYIEELKNECPELRELDIEIVDELRESERADSYDYYYVPTIYLGEQKLSEGVITKERMAEILKQATKQ